MPDLEPKTELKNIISTKFVRIGNRICYSDNPFATHADIAIENGVTEMVPIGDDIVPYVDDSGMVNFAQVVNRIVFFNESNGTKVKGDPKDSRQETIRVAKIIFGDLSVSDTVSFATRPPTA